MKWRIVVRWGAGDLPTGTGPAAALDQRQWEGLYTRLENGAGSSGAVRPLVAVLAATAPLRPDGPLPIGIAHFSYGVPDDPATHETFFAAALLHDQWGLAQPTYRGRTVPFLVSEDVPPRPAPPPDKVELDPGDGGGFRAGRARHAADRHVRGLRGGHRHAALHVRRRHAHRRLHRHAQRPAGGAGPRPDDRAQRRMREHGLRVGLSRQGRSRS